MTGIGDGVLPNYVVIGAAKSGTTSLAYYLAAHPEVFMAPFKEVRFFDREDHWQHGVGWYRSHFVGAEGKLAIGEATPAYLAVPQAVERMASVIPSARLIAVLRNPVDHAYSHYWHARLWDSEARSFAEVVDAGEGAGDPAAAYLADGRYVEQLRRVRAHYPAESLLVLLLEDLAEQPAATFSRVCSFLGVDPTIRPANLGRVYNPSHRRRRWLNDFMQRHRLWRRLPVGLARRIGEFNQVPVTPPPMEPALRRELLASYAEDNRALSSWLGVDLSRWSV